MKCFGYIVIWHTQKVLTINTLVLIIINPPAHFKLNHQHLERVSGPAYFNHLITKPISIKYHKHNHTSFFSFILLLALIAECWQHETKSLQKEQAEAHWVNTLTNCTNTRKLTKGISRSPLLPVGWGVLTGLPWSFSASITITWGQIFTCPITVLATIVGNNVP